MNGITNPGVTAFQIPGYSPEAIGMMGPMTGLPETSGLVNPSMSGGFGGLGFTDKVGLGLQGLSTVAGLVMGLKQLSLANKQFNFQKQFATTNLANQVKSYNTALSDRLRSRAVMETGSTAGSDQAIAANSLKTSY